MVFKNSLTTLPGGVVFIWITLQLCFASVAPGGVLEFFARTPRWCVIYLGIAYSCDLLKVPALVF